MARQQHWEYIYVHGHDEQLFNLQRVPRERQNLADDSAYGDIKSQLKKAILQRFDTDRIEREIQRDIHHRRLIHRANLANRTAWVAHPDLSPNRNTAAKYLP